MTPNSLPPTFCPPAANDDVPVPPPMNESDAQRAKTRQTMPPVELSLHESSGPNWASQIPPSSTLPETVPPMRVGGTLPPLSLSLDETELYEPSQSMPHSSALPKASPDVEIAFLPPVFVDAFSGPAPLDPAHRAATDADEFISPLYGWQFEIVGEMSAEGAVAASHMAATEGDGGGFHFTDPAHGAGNRSVIELSADSYRLWESYDAPMPGSVVSGAQALFEGPVTLIESGTHKVSRHHRVLQRKPLLGKRAWVMAVGASVGLLSVWSTGLVHAWDTPKLEIPNEALLASASASLALPIPMEASGEKVADGEPGEAIGGLAVRSGHLMVVATPQADLGKPVKRPNALMANQEAVLEPVREETLASQQLEVSRETVLESMPVSSEKTPPSPMTEAQTDKNLPGPGVKVEWGRVTLPLEGGRVARSFTLDGPPRVVVDLEGATAPLRFSQEIGEKGVERIRMGRPDTKHVRVVVELGGNRKPDRPSTLHRDGELAIAWR